MTLPRRLPALLLALSLAAAPLQARSPQDVPPVTGSVVTPGGEPLADARVRAERPPGTAGEARPAAPGRGARAGPREAVTDADGRFRLHLPPGRWHLRVTAFGYRAAEREIEVPRDAAPTRLRVRLEPDPVSVRSLRVEADRGLALSVPLPRAQLVEAPALAEPDVFRAAARKPGVGQPNDLQGRLHLAGGASDETGVLLDGHPLQDPYHLLGLLGALHPSALEGAELRMHHLPASRGGRLSGFLELETRRPPEDGVTVDASASLLSTTATVARSGSGPDVLAFGRVAYADAVAPVIAPDLPRLTYQDALLRVGEELGGGWRTEALGFLSRNQLTGGEIRDFRPTEPLEWGERLLGWRLERRGPGWGVRLRASASDGRTRFEGRNTFGLEEDEATAPADSGRIRIQLERHRVSAEAALVGRGDGWRVEAGATYDDRWYAQAWSGLDRVTEVLSPGIPAEHRAVQGLDVAGLFAEGEAAWGPVTLAAGGRLVGTRLGWRGAPRVRLSLRTGDHLSLEAAVNRRFQWTEVLQEPVEYSVPPPEFLLRTPRRVDVAAVGAAWRGDGRRPPRLRLDVYGKAYGARPLLVGRPEWGYEDRHGYGVLASAAVPLGREASVEISYSYQRAYVRQLESTFPGDWDVPHDLSVQARLPGPLGLRLSAAARVRSGTPFTPLREAEGGDGLVDGPVRSARLPAYVRLDAGLRRSWRLGGARWSGFLHVLNVTDHVNPLEADERLRRGLPGPEPVRAGLPLVPSLGLEVSF